MISSYIMAYKFLHLISVLQEQAYNLFFVVRFLFTTSGSGAEGLEYPASGGGDGRSSALPGTPGPASVRLFSLCNKFIELLEKLTIASFSVFLCLLMKMLNINLALYLVRNLCNLLQNFINKPCPVAWLFESARFFTLMDCE